MEWIDINDEKPTDEQEVIAVGTWFGEIVGYGAEFDESEFIGMGSWEGNYVDIPSDTYSTKIIDVTLWMPAPDLPDDD